VAGHACAAPDFQEPRPGWELQAIHERRYFQRLLEQVPAGDIREWLVFRGW